MIVRNLLWWFVFTTTGVGLQWIVPGVDFLLPGLLASLQERNMHQLCCVLIPFVLIQEGLGSLHFGGILIWYLIVLFVASIGYKLFHEYNWIFILIIGLFTAVSHYAVISLMCALQSLQFDNEILLYDCLKQLLVTLIVWKLTVSVRRNQSLHEDSSRS